MKPEEAIERLEAKLTCMELEALSCIEMGCHRNCDECEYNYKQGNGEEQKEALSTAIEALEKQKPKKPEIYTDTIQTMSASFDRDVYLCPVCGECICNIEDELPNYCDYCGQAIDTENLEEMKDEEN